MGISDRIRMCAELAGSGDSLAQKAAIPRRTLESYLSGSSEPKASNLSRICEAAGVNGHWLLTGEPPMYLSPADTSAGGDDEYLEVPPYADARGTIVTRDIARVSLKRSWLAMNGVGVRELAFITMPDDSMASTIPEGGVVVLHTASTSLKVDGIYVLERDGELVVKRLQMNFDGGCLICSDNRAYKELSVSKDKVRTLRIAGKVIYWCGGSL